jgi:plastocyanin
VSTVRITTRAADDRVSDPQLDHELHTSREANEMRRLTRTSSVLLAAIGAAALVATGSGSAATPKTVTGTVGPGFTIGLTLQGKKVTKLKAGTPYRFVINDRADIHDFHLSGPGFSRVFTSVEFTGTKTFVLKLKKGSYRYVCDPHSSFMRGSFVVA